MIKLVLFGSLLLISCLWQLFPYSEDRSTWIQPFLCIDLLISKLHYVYYAVDKFTWVVFAWYVFNESKEYKVALFMFLFVRLGIFVEYFFNYNKDWETIGIYAVSSNTAAFLLYGGAILYEFIKWDRQKS